jgi:hypothetical protein
MGKSAAHIMRVGGGRALLRPRGLRPPVGDGLTIGLIGELPPAADDVFERVGGGLPFWSRCEGVPARSPSARSLF